MKCFKNKLKNGFTLLETVIAIGVLAVLLTGFMVVFAPAAAGIRKSINVQEADRLASTVEQEMVTLRGTQENTKFGTGFSKAYEWIKDSSNASNAILVYQYRGQNGSGSLRTDDQTPNPQVSIKGVQVGKDYKVVPMARRLNSDGIAKFKEDLQAVEGAVYLVKCKQLVFKNGALTDGTPGTIVDPKGVVASVTSAVDYPEAVIAFSADFYNIPYKTEAYITSAAFTSKFPNLKTPVFSRNLAVRR